MVPAPVSAGFQPRLQHVTAMSPRSAHASPLEVWALLDRSFSCSAAS